MVFIKTIIDNPILIAKLKILPQMLLSLEVNAN